MDWTLLVTAMLPLSLTWKSRGVHHRRCPTDAPGHQKSLLQDSMLGLIQHTLTVPSTVNPVSDLYQESYRARREPGDLMVQFYSRSPHHHNCDQALPQGAWPTRGIRLLCYLLGSHKCSKVHSGDVPGLLPSADVHC